MIEPVVIPEIPEIEQPIVIPETKEPEMPESEQPIDIPETKEPEMPEIDQPIDIPETKEPEIPEIELLNNLSLMNNEVDLASNVTFVIQLTVICLFSMMLIGFGIKKLMQVIKG